MSADPADALRQWLDGLHSYIGDQPRASAYDALTALRAERDKLREALRFYADENNYGSEGEGFDTPAQTDCGQIARAALWGRQA